MTLYNNFWLKRGVGLFSRVGLFSGDYGTLIASPCSKCCLSELPLRVGLISAA